jgi:two-component system sensor histidine kinase CreC
LKIRTAIFGVYVAASAVGFAMLMALVLRDVRLRYVESMRRTLNDTAAFLAASVESAGPAVDAWVARLATLPAKTDLLRVFAMDAEGRVVFDSAHGRDVGAVYRWGADGALPATAVDAAVADGELRVRAAVRHDERTIGWVGVGRPLATVTDAIARARWRILFLSLAVAGGMVAAGWWIAAKLTHSLERLTDYALAVRDGRRAEPPHSRAREIAALGRAFEEMRVTLEGKAHVERYTQALAHELKAPLSAIRGAAELLGEEMPSAEREKFVANLRAESDRMQRIVERLFELSALEARRDDAGHVVLPLRRIAEAAARQASAAAEMRGLRLGISGDGGLQVRGEHALLVQAVGNLLQNAFEFTPAGGAVNVSVAGRDGRAEICVEDTGPGVPPYALEKVFDRFYSLPRPDTGRKSSGLGLSIVREIARLHGGEVTLANRPEGGARAVLSLPRA